MQPDRIVRSKYFCLYWLPSCFNIMFYLNIVYRGLVSRAFCIERTYTYSMFLGDFCHECNYLFCFLDCLHVQCSYEAMFDF